MSRVTDGCCDSCACNCASSGCCPGCVAQGVSRSAFSHAMMSARMAGLGGTVGVSPGTYTLQLGAPCPPDPPNVNSWDLYYGRYAVPFGTPLYPGYAPYNDPTTLPLNGVPTLGGVRLDILAGVAALAAGAVVVLSMIAK